MTPRSAERTPVAVLGATGLVGQHLVRLLARHPWFRLAEVVGSEARVGARYGDAVAWAAGGGVPRPARGLRLLAPGAALSSPVVLSALPAAAAHCREPELAVAGHRVSSNASAHRMDPCVPLIVPEVNPQDVALLHAQPWAAHGGSLVTNPNCVVAGLAPVLAPLHRRWGIEGAVITTLQALSGAGLAGPAALEMTGNVVPFIAGEEEKIAAELRRLLGCGIPVDVAVNRVPVPHGHLAHVFLRLERRAEPEEIADELRGASGPATDLALPSLPPAAVRVTADPLRPQPRLDLGRGRGMQVTVGRIRRGAAHDVAFAVLSHNLVRGAAGACLANAELVEAHRRAAERAA